MKLTQELIRLGQQLERENEAAHDLWTWLPSYKVAQQHHGDYAMEFRPSNRDVMVEASMLLAKLVDVVAERALSTKSLIDKICFNIGNTVDNSELWAAMKRDPDAFRSAVHQAFDAQRDKSTPEDREWFERCPCGEDHA